MTGEQFHDALTLLPEDLVAQADKLRSRKPKIVPWKRYAAMAASLAVLLCAAAFYRHSPLKSTPTKMAAAPFAAMREEASEDTEAVDAAAPRIETAMGTPETSGSTAMADSAISFTCVETPVNVHTTASFVHGPSATGITSREELDAYLSKWDRLYLLDALRDTCQIYDAGWFASHDLLLIPVDGISAGQTCVITDMTLQDGHCDITIALTGEVTAETTNYHILVPIEKSAVSDSEQVIIHFDNE